MASFNLAPICNNWQSFLDSGAINNGGWIYTYLAGTSSPLPTYTSSTGSIANPSQIQLLANGRPPNPIWLPSGFAYKFIIYDHLLNQVGITEDNIVGVGDTGFAVTSEWIQLNGGPPVYSSANGFTFPGNQTGIFLPGRRVLAYVTAGIVYGYVTNSSFGAGNTTVTLVMDSGQALDSGMSAIYYAFLSSLHASVPERILYPLSITALTTTNWSADSLLQNTGNTQPAFHAHSSAPVTIGTQIAFNTVDRDNTVSYSFVSGTYTVPVTGWYHFDAYVQIINTTGSTQNINIILNANSQAIGSSSVPSLLTATGQAVSVSGTYYMTAGQSVYIQTAALSANYTAQGHFSGYLIF